MIQRVGLLGFGEVGQLLADQLPAAASVSTYDKLFAEPESIPSRALRARRARAVDSANALAADAQLVISAVTAGESLDAARSVVDALAPDALFLDLNSVAPATRTATAALFAASHANYIEAAVMAPIQPQGMASPILLGGPHATSVAGALSDLGFTGTRAFARELGRASAVKMCRSVLVKGVEALFAESLLAASHYGVVDEVLSSLNNFLPPATSSDEWLETAQYLAERTTQHGARRAEEMREVAATVAQAGLDPWMSRACAERQQWAAQHPAAFEQADLIKGTS